MRESVDASLLRLSVDAGFCHQLLFVVQITFARDEVLHLHLRNIARFVVIAVSIHELGLRIIEDLTSNGGGAIGEPDRDCVFTHV